MSPLFSATNTRPSAANRTAVGLVRFDQTIDSWNPEGSKGADDGSLTHGAPGACGAEAEKSRAGQAPAWLGCSGLGDCWTAAAWTIDDGSKPPSRHTRTKRTARERPPGPACRSWNARSTPKWPAPSSEAGTARCVGRRSGPRADPVPYPTLSWPVARKSPRLPPEGPSSTSTVGRVKRDLGQSRCGLAPTSVRIVTTRTGRFRHGLFPRAVGILGRLPLDRSRRDPRTSTPVARRGRKATGLTEPAGLPKESMSHVLGWQSLDR